MGIVILATLGAVLTSPLQGEAGRGMGIVVLATLGTVLTSPFKGEDGRGMGFHPSIFFTTHPHPAPSP
jgi:hypothetical protein